VQLPRLANLKLSLAGIEDADVDISPRKDTHYLTERMTGIAKLDRPTLVAKIPSLVMLNSTPIPVMERRDAETLYIASVKRISESASQSRPEEWGRFDELCREYNVSPVSGPPPVASSALKGKMISKLGALI
jgi:hypothetical protein